MRFALRFGWGASQTQKKKAVLMKYTITNKYCLYINVAHYTRTSQRSDGLISLGKCIKENGRQNDFDDGLGENAKQKREIEKHI